MAESAMPLSRARSSARPSRNARTSRTSTIGATSQGSRGSRPENRRVTQPPPRISLWVRLRRLFGEKRLDLASLRRAGLRALQLAAATAVGFGLYTAGKLLLSHLETAPGFATTQIDVQGAAQLSKSEIARLAGLEMGKNVFQVDAEEAMARLRAEPWIESATVQRRLPGTYHIQVKERRALALLSAGDLYLVSEDGAAFKKLGPGDPADLPLVTGLNPASIEHDTRAAASVLKQAVGLLREYAEAGLARREPISEVRVEADGTLSLFVGADATYVRLGKSPYRSKLRRLREVFGQLATQRARAQYVYLDNERRQDRVTVRLR